jgi:hypothetical protein
MGAGVRMTKRAIAQWVAAESFASREMLFARNLLPLSHRQANMKPKLHPRAATEVRRNEAEALSK